MCPALKFSHQKLSCLFVCNCSRPRTLQASRLTRNLISSSSSHFICTAHSQVQNSSSSRTVSRKPLAGAVRFRSPGTAARTFHSCGYAPLPVFEINIGFRLSHNRDCSDVRCCLKSHTASWSIRLTACRNPGAQPRVIQAMQTLFNPNGALKPPNDRFKDSKDGRINIRLRSLA